MSNLTHLCPAGCGAQVVYTRFACVTDWYRLPDALRRRITRGYQLTTPFEHAEAMREARRWYDANPTEAVHTRHQEWRSEP